MPESTETPPVDGQQGTPPVAGGADAPKPVKTFTQEELDAILEARLKRAVPSDYEDLKKLADRVKAEEDAKKDELQKAKDAQAEAEKRATDAITRANASVRRAAIIEAATAANAADNETVVALLDSSDAITVAEDGSVKGAKEAVTKLLKDKPFLVKTSASSSGGEFGGNDQSTLDEQIAAAEAKKDWTLSRQLKLQRMKPGA